MTFFESFNIFFNPTLIMPDSFPMSSMELYSAVHNFSFILALLAAFLMPDTPWQMIFLLI